MTEQQLKEIEARAEAATPGPWRQECFAVYDPGGRELFHTGFGLRPSEPAEANAALIATSRTDIPSLCAALREAWAALDGAVVCMDAWAGHLGKDPCNNDNYCRAKDIVRAAGRII